MSQNTKPAVATGSYKGNPTISLDAASKYPFTFGLKKAALIVEFIDEIRSFVAKNQPAAPDRFDMAVEDQMRDACNA